MSGLKHDTEAQDTARYGRGALLAQRSSTEGAVECQEERMPE